MNQRFSNSLLALSVATGLSVWTGPSIQADQAGTQSAKSSTTRTSNAKAAERKSVEAKTANSEAADANEEKLAPVIDPGKNAPPAAVMAYAAAKGCPHVCNNLFCYCGCDMTDNHKCLLDCFTGMHGVECHICMEESMVALRMSRNDEPLAAIQKNIDELYSRLYPYQNESPALKHYKSVRKWRPAAGNSTGGGPEGSH